MAPDRGEDLPYQSLMISRDQEDMDDNESTIAGQLRSRNDSERFLAQQASHGQNFTVRGVLVGLAVGLVICFSNMYFGLQTGWISSMSMPASLIGFAYFKTVSKYLDLPFTEVENVLVQTVAGSMGTMPLGCGFVGVMPALNYMLSPKEQGPLILSLWKLIIWALGLCYFGVLFAVPLRQQVIIREKLKFPSGTATALMISVLHGKKDLGEERQVAPVQHLDSQRLGFTESVQSLRDDDRSAAFLPEPAHPLVSQNEIRGEHFKQPGALWKERVKVLVFSFLASGLYTLSTYFFPILRNLPIFGLYVAESWLWTLNPSLAYVGQGIIMGPTTTLHMFLGAVIGWGVLSPLAKYQGWAPGPVNDWESGSRGWIVWISLAIMLADSVVSLGYLMIRSFVLPYIPYIALAWQNILKGNWDGFLGIRRLQISTGYQRIGEEVEQNITSDSVSTNPSHLTSTGYRISPGERNDLPDVDAPPEHLISSRVVWIGLFLSVTFCVICIHFTFGASVPLHATVLAVLMALILSVMGVRALGETDLNPVSGISKLAQLFFALLIPQSNANSVIINLVAGAVSEAGALQAGDLMQDLKTGHLLGAAPNAQFWGQIIGSTAGAIVSALIYKLYTSVYTVPGELFQVPTGYVWIFTARLVTGKGLPDMAWQWALGAAIVFTITTLFRLISAGASWHPYIPGGIAVAVGMYNLPSFTIARAIGGIFDWFWRSYLGREETPIIVLASGLILGEGVMSILNLLMASISVPHL